MWFKNVRVYTVALDEGLKSILENEQRLEERLNEVRFKKTSQLEMSSCGFSPVFGRNTEALSYTNDHNHFFRFTEESKLLPATIINQALADEIETKEEELGRTLKKNEKAALKQALVNKMTAQAFTTRKELFLWINSRYGYVGVSATAAKRAENATTYLRKALGSFPCKSLQPRCVVEDRLTSFISKGDLPQDITLGNDLVLKSSDDTGGTIRVSKDDLTTPEILSHIKSGKVVTDVQLNFNQDLQFVLNSDLLLKRIAIEDQYLERNLPQKSDDKVADLQGQCILEADVLTQLIGKVIAVFDCEHQ